jgi:hypothetical protein
VTTTAPLSKTKPSLQTQFVLQAMEEEAKNSADRSDNMQESIDLIFATLES